MSHLKARYINETGMYPIVESFCYYKTEYVQWLEKLAEQNSDSPASPVQKLKAKIALLAESIESGERGIGSITKGMIAMRLRQLSAI